jgi:hypothetical protein
MSSTMEAVAAGSSLLAAHAPVRGQSLGIAALIAWLLTEAAGAYMLVTWILSGGPRRQRERPGSMPPELVFAHAGFAAAGLLALIGYLVTGWNALVWSAVVLLVPAIGLGISTVTVWTPFPGPATMGGPGSDAGPALDENPATGRLTDETLVSALTDEALVSRLVDDVISGSRANPSGTARRPKGSASPLIPAGHGVGALATFLLAVLTAIYAR